MSEFDNIEKVGDQPGHHFSGVVAVIVGERELLIVDKEFPAHIPLHSCPHDVAPAGDEILASVADQVQQQESGSHRQSDPHDPAGIAAENLFDHDIQHLRKSKIDSTHDQSTKHVSGKQSQIGTVVTNESADHNRSRKKVLSKKSPGKLSGDNNLGYASDQFTPVASNS